MNLATLRRRLIAISYASGTKITRISALAGLVSHPPSNGQNITVMVNRIVKNLVPSCVRQKARQEFLRCVLLLCALFL